MHQDFCPAKLMHQLNLSTFSRTLRRGLLRIPQKQHFPYIHLVFPRSAIEHNALGFWSRKINELATNPHTSRQPIFPHTAAHDA